jgi:hypothetical protein
VLRDTDINDLDYALQPITGSDQHIFGLEIAVDDVAIVSCRQTGQ